MHQDDGGTPTSEPPPTRRVTRILLAIGHAPRFLGEPVAVPDPIQPEASRLSGRAITIVIGAAIVVVLLLGMAGGEMMMG